MTDKEKQIHDLLYQYGQIDGDHHKTWVIDQVMRILHGDNYEAQIKEYEYKDSDGNETEEKGYTLDIGVAP